MTKLSRGLLHWTGGKRFTGNLFGSREEMRLFMQESAQSLTSEERQMINRVLDLQHSTVRNLMMPMDKVVTVDAPTPMGEALKLARDKKLTRLPVWRVEGNQKKIAGIVSMRSVLYRADLDLNKPAGDYLKPALYLEEDAQLEQALKRMQRSGQRLAIVLGRDQRETGIVSLQDIFKVIFGEVRL
jgi:CBS domain containing-hemolysin-like protein